MKMYKHIMVVGKAVGKAVGETEEHPFVSVLCPTYNRQALIPLVVEQFMSQRYPKDRMELVILDDSSRKWSSLPHMVKVLPAPVWP